MVDLEYLKGKNAAFSRFGIKESNFLCNSSQVLRQRTGIIYVIVNLVNGKVYVGLSKRSFKERYTKGWWITTDNEHLMNASQKYGHENFRILILEECRGLNILNILETYYILSFQSNKDEYGYNKTTGGNSYIFSPDTLEKMRLASPLLKNTDEFIKEAKVIHGNKFDYSKVDYINSDTNIDIFCNKHQNFFKQTPATHLISKIGCPKCVLEDSSKRYSMPFEEFRKRSQDKYGDEFIYYPETFTRIHKPTKLTHKTCNNTFDVYAYSHLISKTGCKHCGENLKKQTFKNNFLIKSTYEKERIAKVLHITDYQNFTLRQLKSKLRNKTEVENNQENIKRKQKDWYFNLVKQSKLIHGDNKFSYINYGETKKGKLHLKCNTCQREFLQKVYDHINLKRGCSECKHLNIKELHAPSTT